MGVGGGFYRPAPMFPGQDDIPREHRRAAADAATTLILGCMHDMADVDHGLSATRVLNDQAVLPPRYAGFYDVIFAQRFLVTLITVAWKLASADTYELSSVAEELALNAIIGLAEDELASAGPRDEHLTWFHSNAFEDLDFEWLWSDRGEGIGESDIGRAMGMGNLAFRDWFEPFHASRGHVHPFTILDSEHA